MKAKAKAKTVRTSAKQKLAEYRMKAVEFMYNQARPTTQSAFSVATYEILPTGGKKPNALSAPELAAIVGTAQKLGKQVQVVLYGNGDATKLNFNFVDAPSSIPLELLQN
jgi:hypothetical protein